MVNKDYYALLTEAIENKYKKKTLNEAWSDSMPDWLKPRLNALGLNDKIGSEASSWGSDLNIGDAWEHLKKYPRFMRAYRRYVDAGAWHNSAVIQAAKDIGWTPQRVDSVKPRGASWEEQVNARKDIFTQFRNVYGIDLTKAVFVETTPPKSAKSPAMQEGNIPIWYIPSTNQIYAKGINDYETLSSGADSDFTFKAFKYIPLKELASLCDGHFCYIEGSSIDTTGIPRKLGSRAANKEWVNNNPEMIRGVPGDTKRVWIRTPEGRILKTYTATRDASGYLVVPPSEKYRDIIEKNSATKKYSKKIQELEDRLKQYYSILVSAPRLGTWKKPIDTKDALTYYTSALGSYKQMLDDIDAILKEFGPESKEFINYLTSTNSSLYYICSKWRSPFKESVSSIERVLDRVARELRDYDFTILDI